MNKRQKKKKLKQQMNGAAKQKKQDKPESVNIIKDDSTVDENAVTQNTSAVFRFFLFTITFLILELGMACSTGGHFFSHYGIYITLFCVGYGLLFQLVTTLTKRERINRILQAGCLFFVSFGFCVIYFLYCEFQLFYDLNTMIAGASDAVGDFSGDIVAMVMTSDGLSHIFLFFLPVLLYLILDKKCSFAEPTDFKTKGKLLVSCGAIGTVGYGR